jgi:hypothetical protein
VAQARFRIKRSSANRPARVEQGFDATMTSASCNSQFLVSITFFSNVKVSAIDETRVSYRDADTIRAFPAGDRS